MRLILKLFISILLFLSIGELNAQTYQWANKIGGTGTDHGACVYTDNNGFVYVSGYFNGSNIDFDPSATGTAFLSSSGNRDGFVAKYTSSGQYIWAFKIGGADKDEVRAVTADGFGNVFITGYLRGSNVDFDPSAATAFVSSNGDGGSDPGYGGDIFVAKYNSSGQYQWAFNIGGTEVGDAGITIASDNASNVYVSGYFNGASTDFNPSPSVTNALNAGSGTMFLAKYNTNGIYQWAFNLGLGNASNSSFGMKADAAGNVYMTGYFQGTNQDFNPSPTATNNLSSNGNFDVFVAKYNTLGQYQWAFAIGGSNLDVGRDIEIDPTGNVYVVGDFDGTNVDFDPSPTGTTLLSSSGYDVFVAKYNSSGQLQWAKKYGGTGNDISWSLAYYSNAIYITGSFQNTINFSPTGTDNLTSNGANDFYLTKFDVNGSYICSFAVGGAGNDDAYRIDADNAGKLYVTGILSSSNVDFNPSTSVSNTLSTNGDSDVFFASYTWPDNVAATGTFTGSTLACSSSVLGQLTFTATTGTGPFTVQYSNSTSTYTQTNVQSGVPFNLTINPTVTTNYTLVSIRGSEKCAAVNYPSGITATVVVNPCATVSASFTAPDTVCVNTPINIVNQTTGASNYYWNFCVANANSNPTATNLGNINGQFDVPCFMDIVFDNNNYYGFVTNNYPGKLTRLDFGNSLLNTPVAVNLGNVGGIIPDAAEGIQVIKNEGAWYAIIVGGNVATGGSKIVRINFGASITNTSPTGTNWGNVGVMDYPHDLHIFQDGTNWYGLTVNFNNHTITRFNFGTNFNNTPTAVNLGNVGNLNRPSGINAVFNNNKWYVFVSNRDGNSLTRLNFGTSLLNTPTGINLGNISGTLDAPRDFFVISFCGSLLGYLVNEGNNGLVKFDFNQNIESIPTGVSLGNTGSMSFPVCITKLFRVGADLYSFVTNATNNSITSLKFTGCSNSSIPNSTLQNPPPVTYNAVGTYNINLAVDEGLSTQSSFCKQIVVVAAPAHAPTQNISICNGDSVTLSSNQINATYNWSNGSTGNSIKVKTAGTYWVESTVTGGCSVRDSMIVTLKTTPSVYAGSDVSICGNDSAQLNATGGTGNFTWSPTSGLNNPNIGTPKAHPLVATDYIVTLTGSNGCYAKDTVKVSVLSAATVDFSYKQDVCNPKSVQFFNTSPSTSTFTWDFGNSSTNTTSSSPTVTYANYGTYNVSLSISANNGCIGTTSRTIPIVLQQDSLITGNDTSICLGSSITLPIIGTSLGYCWTPAATINSANPSNVVITPTANTTYYYNSQVAGSNLVANADFSAGNTGFVSGNLYAPIFAQQTYWVGSNPQSWNGIATSCRDHTSGTGNMFMLANGNVPNSFAWAQTIPVTANTVYSFSTWVQRLSPILQSPIINLSINGNVVGTYDASSMLTSCTWGKASINWNSGNNTSATISISQEASLNSTYAIALDDIYFGTTQMKQDSIKINVTPQPVVTSSALPNAVCEADSSQLSASGTTNFIWSPATGLSNPNIANPKASPNGTTTYTVSGYNIAGCAGTNTVTVTINAKPAITKTANANICKDSTVQISASATNAASYSWLPVTGLSNPAISNPTATPISTTNYFVTVTGTNSCTNKDSILVTVLTKPSVQVRTDTSVCNKTPLILTTNSTGATSFAWQPAIGLSSTSSSSPTATPTSSTQYIVTADNGSCTSRDTINLGIKPLPTVSKSIDTTICKTGSANLTVSGGASYSWQPAYALNSTTSGAVVATPDNTTKYYITVTGSNSCSITDSINVTVNPKPVFGLQPISASICKGDTVLLTASGGDAYTWMPSTNMTAPMSAVTRVYPSIPTLYKVGITSIACKFTDTLSSMVSLNGTLSTTVTSSNDIDCSHGQSTLHATGGIMYEWLPALGISSLTSANPVVSPTQTTTYYVKVTDAKGCSGLDSVKVNVDFTSGASQFLMPSAFTPNGDGKNDCLGLKFWGSVTQLDFSIYSRWGQMIFHTTNPGDCWDGTFKGEKQDPGTFVYQIKAKTVCGDVYRKGTVVLVR